MDICRISGKEEFLAAFAAATRAEQEALLEATARDRPAPGGIAVVLAIALPAVSIAGLPRGPYVWVGANLLVSLIYPILLWLAVYGGRQVTAGGHDYLRTLRALGLLEPGRKLGYLAGTAFVINARAAAPAFAWFATVNLLVALGWLNGPPAARGLGLVIAVQSVFSLAYSLTVWRVTPGVGHLRERTAAVRTRFRGHRAAGWTVLALLSVPAALVAFVLFTLLVLPGPPVFRVLAEGRVSPLVQTLEFAVLIGGLYAVVRTAHSVESRRLARQVAEAIVRYLDAEVAPRMSGTAAPAVMDCEDYRILFTRLLEARVYRFARTTVAGMLPVYTLAPDYTLVADPETLAALRGHLALGPAG